MKNWEVHHGGSPEEMGRLAAQFLVEEAERCLSQSDGFSLALSGGTSSRGLYEILAEDSHSSRLLWNKIHLFWGDERFLPKDHPDSNYAMAWNALISRVPVPEENVHPVPVQCPTPDAAAVEYESTLRRYFQMSGRNSDQVPPQFDLILLGMGPDGHTASLFPGHEALGEQVRWIVPIADARGNPPVPRISFSLPLINAARTVMFLVSGQGKKDVLKTIFDDPDTASGLYPAARVRPAGRLVWFHDVDLT